jgi:endoglucanase
VKKLDLGWNLGNSLDVPEGETAWGNPRVSSLLLQKVAQSGFDLVRIPVTWSKHMGPGPDYAIDPGFLERVTEVVGYARDAGLYAIINVHHDGADGFEGVEWITLNDAQGNTTNENNTLVRKCFVAVWQQIARHFADFGEELWFESMNEIQRYQESEESR